MKIALVSADLKQRMEYELRGNILPFWLAHAADHEKGGFHGSISNDLVVDDSVERSLVLCARMLWTYSAAYRFYRDPQYLEMARHAYAALTGPFLDKDFGGMYWRVDSDGAATNTRKQTYGQAFAIYALAEYHRASGEEEPLRLAQELFRLIEDHAGDPLNGGYIEGCARDWSTLADMRLSDKEPFNCPKSMNTLLHILEGYTNLLRVWDHPHLRQQQVKLVEIFFARVINPRTHLTRLFFELDWQPLGDRFSFGHDIECSWLLVEAAEVLGDETLTARARETALQMADEVYQRGLDKDGSLFAEGGPEGVSDPFKHWWAHAEGVVGFFNASEICAENDTPRQERYLNAALRLWEYIEAEFIDHQHGEWFKVLDRIGTPLPGQPKAGPWEDPYHQSRACMEIIRRA
ncbi:MAG: AGE family epimerase/isomerase [Anaerolineaceae bacterium]|nr:AGE family epimerase/isomerase [Anaerolineaceae bacterium]